MGFYLEKERWDFHIKRINDAVETASKMVDVLRPGIDPTTKGNLIQPLIPTLSEPNGIEKLETALLLPVEKLKATTLIEEIKVAE